MWSSVSASAGLGGLLGIPFLSTADLGSSKFMIYGLALVLMMMLRPEGIFPSRQRRAELHEEAPTVIADGV